MVAQVKICYGINIKYHHAYKEKESSQEKIYDDDVKIYTDLVWYVEAIKAINPGSYVNFEYNKQTKRFERLFICFAACIKGYKFIFPTPYYDATFLTRRFKGTLMASTGVNGNQGFFFPFAFALVPSEDIEGWEWFMENLQYCVDDRPIYFITDLHKGQKQSIPKLRIVTALLNMSLLWMRCIIGCVWAVEYLIIIDPKQWENAFFVGCRYGTHSSSIAESFNSWIHRERNLLPASLVDDLRIKIMRISSEKRDLGRTYLDSLTPIYKAILKKHVDIDRLRNVTESGNDIYEGALSQLSCC
ncbi:uncharacterized protein LOC113338463 [Papaver somniferum]|uniref:uncharacterized protein LOC113338463 n=1 Tax=Papaver somniferum TaxID=3469 RepID=UPI000E6F9AA2|nr:uncharacterized protein LOC113338463 [Papaver somniferum]